MSLLSITSDVPAVAPAVQPAYPAPEPFNVKVLPDVVIVIPPAPAKFSVSVFEPAFISTCPETATVLNIF